MVKRFNKSEPVCSLLQYSPKQFIKSNPQRIYLNFFIVIDLIPSFMNGERNIIVTYSVINHQALHETGSILNTIFLYSKLPPPNFLREYILDYNTDKKIEIHRRHNCNKFLFSQGNTIIS